MKIDFVACASRSGLFQFALEAVREKVHLHSHLIVSAAFHVDLLADRENRKVKGDRIKLGNIK